MTGVWIPVVFLVPLLVVAAAAIFTRRVATRVTTGFAPRGVFIETSAGRVHVLEQGRGHPIVLVHGLGGQIGNFSHSLMDRLADRYRLIAIDRLGAGYSDAMAADFTGVRRHADVVAEVMIALEVEPALIVGHSLGGAVALALAIDHPGHVRGLALLAPLTTVQPDPPAAFRGLMLTRPWQRRLMAHTFAIPLSILRRKTTLDALFGPDAAPSDFPTRGLGLLSLRPQAFIGAATDMVHANDDLPGLQARYPDIAVPVSVLFARQDLILNPERHGAGLVGAIPGAVLTLMDGGHMIPVTAPDRVAAFVDKAAHGVFHA